MLSRFSAYSFLTGLTILEVEIQNMHTGRYLPICSLLCCSPASGLDLYGSCLNNSDGRPVCQEKNDGESTTLIVLLDVV